MKIVSVFGITGSGKTTTIEAIIQELSRRRYSVGSLKEIHYEQFAIDTEGTNTYRHREAGASLVTARGQHETDILYPRRLALEDVLQHYSQEYVVLEGVAEGNFPKIITAHNPDEADERMDPSVIALAGRISHTCSEYRGLPVFNAMEDSRSLVDWIEKHSFSRLPDFPAECCMACGRTCRQLGVEVMHGRASVKDCMIESACVKLHVGGRDIPMVPFVEKILANAVRSVVTELDGFQEGKEIVVRIRP